MFWSPLETGVLWRPDGPFLKWKAQEIRRSILFHGELVTFNLHFPEIRKVCICMSPPWTTELGYGTTDADAGVGIGLKSGIQKFDKKQL